MKAGKSTLQSFYNLGFTYPNYQWSIRGDVDKRWGAIQSRVKEVLLNIKDPKSSFLSRKSFRSVYPTINQSSMC